MPNRRSASAPGALISSVSVVASPPKIACVIAVWSSARSRMGGAPLDLGGERMMVADSDTSRRGAAGWQESLCLLGSPRLEPIIVGLHGNRARKQVGPHGLAQ